MRLAGTAAAADAPPIGSLRELMREKLECCMKQAAVRRVPCCSAAILIRCASKFEAQARTNGWFESAHKRDRQRERVAQAVWRVRQQ